MFKLGRSRTAERLALAIPSKGLRRLLVASLAANLLIVGFLVGDFVADIIDNRPRSIEMSLGPIARALHGDDRKAILNDLRNNPVMADFHHGVANVDSSGLARVLRTEPFDATAFRAALEAQAEKVFGAQRALQDSLIAHISSMSADERKEIADHLANND